MTERVDEATDEAPALTYRGLDLCDGCGARLDPGERLSGLCRDCEAPVQKGSRPRREQQHDR